MSTVRGGWVGGGCGGWGGDGCVGVGVGGWWRWVREDVGVVGVWVRV